MFSSNILHSPAISSAVAAGGCWRSTATAVVAGTVVFLWHLRIATKPSQPSSQAPPRSPCYDGVFRAAPAAAQASSSQNAISAAAAACPAAPALQRCGHRGWNACSHSSDGTLQDAQETHKLGSSPIMWRAAASTCHSSNKAWPTQATHCSTPARNALKQAPQPAPPA